MINERGYWENLESDHSSMEKDFVYLFLIYNFYDPF